MSDEYGEAVFDAECDDNMDEPDYSMKDEVI